jgi:D-inositol-3-phosphate glycosyltransferase
VKALASTSPAGVTTVAHDPRKGSASPRLDRILQRTRLDLGQPHLQVLHSPDGTSRTPTLRFSYVTATHDATGGLMAVTRRVVLVGPSYPYRGGIVDHTAALAANLHAAGALAEFAAWGSQFPRRIYRGSQDSPAREVQPPGGPSLTHDLHWNRPDSWMRVGRRLGELADNMTIVVSSPLQTPAFSVIAAAFRNTAGRATSRINAIIHNIRPHEPTAWDALLTRSLLRIPDVTIVHSQAQCDEGVRLGGRDVRSVELPFHPPGGIRRGRHGGGERRQNRLAFIGFVREYKGLDLLLRALARTDTKPHLVILGEFWEPRDRYEKLIRDLCLQDRVEIDAGFARGEDISETLARVDAVVLPYRTATGSQQPRLAFAHGVPVIITPIAGLLEQVSDGADAVVAARPDPDAIATAIDRFYGDGEWLRLRHGVCQPDAAMEWSRYLAALGIGSGSDSGQGS